MDIKTVENLLNILKIGYSSDDNVTDASIDEVSIMKTFISSVHHYKISKAPDGRWITRVPDPTRPDGRRQIRKKTEHELVQFLIEFYGKPAKEGKTFAELFQELISYKMKYVGASNLKKSISPSTIRRYQRDYDSYIKGTDFDGQSIKSITPIMLENFITDMIKNHQLKEKSTSNVIGYICQAFSYAMRSGYIDKDPSSLLDRQLALSTCAYAPPHEDGERILTESELVALAKAVQDHEAIYPDYLPDYGIELALLTGMRVGEISALKWDGITKSVICVDYSEHRLDYSDRPCELVVGEPKNGKHRQIPLTDDMRHLFDRIKALGHSGEYVLSNADGRRCTGHDIGCAVARRGKEAGITGRVSIHQIRRTVSSLLRNTLPVSAVARMLGHNESTNTRFYAYDTTEEEARREALAQIGTVIPFSRTA